MMARKIQIILLRASGIFWTNTQKNTNPRFGTVIIGGPPRILHARPKVNPRPAKLTHDRSNRTQSTSLLLYDAI